jgi:hypothetical protein
MELQDTINIEIANLLNAFNTFRVPSTEKGVSENEAPFDWLFKGQQQCSTDIPH